MYIKLPGADVVLLTEGNIIGCDTASATWTRRGLRPWHVNTISTREPGDLPSDHLPVSEMARTGKTWGEALTGVLTGQPLSHEMYIKLPGADVVLLTEGNIIGCDT
ncbi:hypothetical protein XC70_19945, partial [Klebsiella pneumoniae]|nr:hypothetical protein [Klebsiella pneumoniae]